MIMPKDVVDRMNEWTESKEGRESERRFLLGISKAAIKEVLEMRKR